MKLVSIGMITRNHAHCISNAIDSLLAQTHGNIELIIVDGASEDNTKQICEEYANRDKRVRYKRSETNQGLVKDFANVLAAGRGEYYMWAADDDWWHPKFVETIVAVLEKNPNYGVAMSNFSEHFEYKYDPAKIGKIFKHDYTDKSYSEVYSQLIPAKMNPIFLHGGIFRRELLTGLYRRLVPDCIDGFTIVVCEAALSMRFYSIPEVLHSKYRNPEPLAKRHSFIGKEYSRSFPRTRYIFTILGWLLSSPNIPLSRKSLIFGPWFRCFWRNKKGILSEIKSALI